MATNPEDRLRIVPATKSDIPVILALIKELAEYERLAHEVVATEEILTETLFGERPYAEVLLAHYENNPVGYALFFHSYSTFLGRPGLYLEDLYVRPSLRGKGIGKALLATLARIALDRKCGRLEWAVLNWNEPAIGFYKSLGAKPMDTWTVYRITAEPLAQLASASRHRTP
ncbi:MAG: GNAT family N-acetyltransferase [Bacteroidota bacterium]|jgi:GNAT superfamily N-acetyltransferase